MPELSIVVTSFNIKAYIEDCLDSIFAQTYSDYELIIVDDASTDGTAELIEQKCKGRPNCRVIQLSDNTPGGAGAPSNVGIDASTGDYIGFVDGDDYADPSMFAELMATAKRDDADVVMCKHQNFTNEGEVNFIEPADAHRWTALLKSEADKSGQTFKLDVLKMISVPWRKIYRRSFLNRHKIRFPEGDFFYEDNPFHWFTTYAAERISLVPKELIFHRVDRAGQTMSTTDAKLLKMFQHFSTILKFLDKAQAPRGYRVQLCRWAISQMEWISERVDARFRQQLFQAFRGCLVSQAPSMTQDAVRQQGIDMRGAALTWFALNEHEQRFLQYVDGHDQLSISEQVRVLYFKSGIVGTILYPFVAVGSATLKVPSILKSLLTRHFPSDVDALRAEVKVLKTQIKALEYLVLADQQHNKDEGKDEAKRRLGPEQANKLQNRFVPNSVAKDKHYD